MQSSSPKKSPSFAACLPVFYAYLLAWDLLQLRAALHTDSRSDQAQLASRALETVYESLRVDLLPFMDVRAIFNATDSESELYRQFLLDYHAAQQHYPTLFTRLLSSQEDAVAAFMCAACDLSSLMHEALDVCNIQAFNYLIAHPGFDVNAPNHKRNTHLHTAIIDVHKHAYTGFAEILLTDPRLDINRQGQHNYTPLDLAIRNLNVDQTPYNIAFVTKLLAHPDIDLNRSTTQHLPECIRRHLFTTARELFTHPTQNKYLRDGDGHTPLMNACQAFHDRHSSRPLQDEHIALFETILDSPETDINAKSSYSSYPVLTFALNCSHFTARLLQQPGIQTNLADRSGHTPLMFAAIYGKPSLQLLLDDPRVDVNQQDEDGNTALHLAQKNKQVDAVEALLQHPHTDPSILNHQHESALPASSQTGRLSINSLFDTGSHLPKQPRYGG